MNYSRTQLRKMRRNIHLAAASLPDADAVETPELFPAWEVDHDYVTDDRVQDEGKLYKCLQAHKSQESWKPSVATSLWTEVKKPGSGTHDDPIQYNGNMELEAGLYYTQFDVLYICTRSSGIPVYNNLADLVGLYVEVA